MRFLRYALLGLLALVVLLAGDDQASAATFSPSGTVCLDDEATVTLCDGDSGTGAVSGIATSFVLPEGDANLDTGVSFIPPEFGIAADADVPDGAIVAELRVKATLGLIGNACNNILNIKFVMMDATTDTSNVMADAFKNLNNDGLPDMMEDRDDDGLPDAVTSYPDFLTRIFPGVTPRARLHGQTSVSGVPVSLSMLIFEPGTVLNTPARTIAPDPGLGFPAVTVLQSNGDPEASLVASAITDFCTPVVTETISFGTSQDNVCTAAGPTPAECSPIGDLIQAKAGPGGTTPDESGVIYRTNPPAAGSYTFTQFSISLRDADGDGHENTLDPCPFDADPNWDPRVGSFGTPQTGDSDGDRIPDGCDQSPNDPFPPSPDVDGDFYLNSGDNCPQVTNGANPATDAVVGPNNQKDSDLDGIGDECDENPNSPDGVAQEVTVVSTVAIIGGEPTPTPTPTPTPGPPNDDFADARLIVEDDLRFSHAVNILGATIQLAEPSACIFLDSTIWYKFTPSHDLLLHADTIGSSVPEPFINVYSGSDSATLHDLGFVACGSTIGFSATLGTTYYIQVGDSYGAQSGTLVFNLERLTSDCPNPGSVPWPVPPGDEDCDGFSTADENFMGTEPQAACATTNTADDEGLPDAWPFDFNDDQRAAIGDVIGFIPVFNTFAPGSPYDPRYDLNASGGITLADVIMYIPVFNTSCAP